MDVLKLLSRDNFNNFIQILELLNTFAKKIK